MPKAATARKGKAGPAKGAPPVPPALRIAAPSRDPRLVAVRIRLSYAWIVNATIEAIFARRLGPFHASGAESGVDVSPGEAMGLFGGAETFLLQTAQLARETHERAGLPVPSEVTAVLSEGVEHPNHLPSQATTARDREGRTNTRPRGRRDSISNVAPGSKPLPDDSRSTPSSPSPAA